MASSIRRHILVTGIALAALFIGAASPIAQAPAAAARNPAVESKTGVVVSSSDIASDIGAAVLGKGGNAVDAAVGTAFARAVTDPFAGNIGGGGFMVVRAPDGKATTFDYRETAP